MMSGDNILLYNEHTWGASASMRQPNAEQTVKQWQVKAGYAHDSDAESRKLLASGMSQLAAMVPRGRSGRVQSAGMVAQYAGDNGYDMARCRSEDKENIALPGIARRGKLFPCRRFAVDWISFLRQYSRRRPVAGCCRRSPAIRWRTNFIV